MRLPSQSKSKPYWIFFLCVPTIGCGDHQFRGDSTVHYPSISAKQAQSEDVSIEDEELSAVTRSEVEELGVDSEPSQPGEAAEPTSPQVEVAPPPAPPKEPCIEGPDALIQQYSFEFNKPGRSVEIRLSEGSEQLSLAEGALADGSKAFVMQFREGASIKVGCIDSVNLNLLGGNDQISIPGVSFNLNVNAGGGDDTIEILGSGDGKGKALQASGGPGNDSFKVFAGQSGWGSVRVDGN